MKIIHTIDVLERWTTRVFILVGAVCLVGIVATIMLNVVMRFVFNSPLMWYLELCSVFVVWLAFLPLGANFLLNRHFIIDTFTRLLPPRLKVIQTVLVDIATLGCVALLAVSALDAIEINGDMPLNTIPVSIAVASYLPVVAGSVSYLILIITRYIKMALYATVGRANG